MILPFKISLGINAVLLAACGALMWRGDILSMKNDKLSSELLNANTRISNMEFNLKTNEEVSHAYQTDIARLNADLKRLRQLKPRCVTISSSAGRVDDPAGNPGGVDGNGLRSEWLYDYAGRWEAEQIRLRNLQDWVLKARCE